VAKPPVRVTDLPSPFDDPTPPNRRDGASGGRTYARTNTSSGPITQVPAVAARDVQNAALALAATLRQLEQRRTVLAFAIATARAAGVPDATIKARLAVAELDDDEIGDALA